MTFAIINFVNTIFVTISMMFFISTKGMFIKRTFMNMPLIIFKSSIIPIDKEENINPHFDLDVLKENVINYLNLNLKDEINTYKLSFFPYKKDINNDKYYLEVEDNIKNIQIHFVINYFMNFEIDSYLCFELNEKGIIKSEY